MIREFIYLWERKEDWIREYISENLDEFNRYEYQDLVAFLIENVLNDGERKFSWDDITRIDYGDYQGTLIFVFHEETYQPGTWETYYTSVEYGSCSGCDTLLGIQSYGFMSGNALEKAEIQIKDYMKLLLDLFQGIHRFKGDEDD